MKYLTGPICFGIPCCGTSKGTWQYTRQDFTNEDKLEFAESDDMPFKDFQIETDKIIPYHDDTELFNVATHTRAYLDMLYQLRFDELKGAYEEYLDSYPCRDIIFHEVAHLMKWKHYKELSQFMTQEFGSHWTSFCLDILETQRRTNSAEQVST